MKTLLKIAFEAGRTFENRRIAFGLTDCIDGNDIAYAKGFGAVFSLKGDMQNFGQILATKGIDERKLAALSEPIQVLEELIKIVKDEK